ncbi:ATP-binding protein [Streptomyces lunaelactis]|uniref:ATP-binding protein n=1 Tax=Streptomyces lunaelactis TaxID=1535768 RepID=UPI001584AF40|nr:ATP-binding protein [Streptomyces lunaelactis]NUL05473.1 ATP-binding protein [Streptomyces lunaelactis]
MTLRIEAADPRAARKSAQRPPAPASEAGRGLLLVEALATTWGTKDRVVGKTAWAELLLP